LREGIYGKKGSEKRENIKEIAIKRKERKK
jgi:hypothetical protein